MGKRYSKWVDVGIVGLLTETIAKTYPGREKNAEKRTHAVATQWQGSRIKYVQSKEARLSVVEVAGSSNAIACARSSRRDCWTIGDRCTGKTKMMPFAPASCEAAAEPTSEAINAGKTIFVAVWLDWRSNEINVDLVWEFDFLWLKSGLAANILFGLFWAFW